MEVPRNAVANSAGTLSSSPLVGEGCGALASAVSLGGAGLGGDAARASGSMHSSMQRGTPAIFDYHRAAAPPIPTFPHKGGRGFLLSGFSRAATPLGIPVLRC